PFSNCFSPLVAMIVSVGGLAIKELPQCEYCWPARGAPSTLPFEEDAARDALRYAAGPASLGLPARVTIVADTMLRPTTVCKARNGRMVAKKAQHHDAELETSLWRL